MRFRDRPKLTPKPRRYLVVSIRAARARRNEPGAGDRYRLEGHPPVAAMPVRMSALAKKLEVIARDIDERAGKATQARAQLPASRFALAALVSRYNRTNTLDGRKAKRQAVIDAEVAEQARRRAVREASAA